MNRWVEESKEPLEKEDGGRMAAIAWLFVLWGHRAYVPGVSPSRHAEQVNRDDRRRTDEHDK